MIRLKTASRKLNISGSMTDISFLLIIFFLVAAIFIADHGLILRLPDNESTAMELYPDEVIVIRIEENGVIFVAPLRDFLKTNVSVRDKKHDGRNKVISDLKVSVGRKGYEVPLYLFYCSNCDSPYEIQMTLAKLEEYDKGDKIIECPNCDNPLTKLICPPKNRWRYNDTG